MGAALSTEESCGEPTGVITVGGAGSATQQGDEAILRQLAGLRHSLPILPDSVAEPSSLWSKSLRGSMSSEAASSSASTVGTHLDPEPLKQLVSDYQRFTRWHCRRIVEQQEKLNAMIPTVDRQAARLHQRLVESCREAAAAQTSMAAVGDVKRELEALTARLGRLQQSMCEVEQLVAAQEQEENCTAAAGAVQ